MTRRARVRVALATCRTLHRGAAKAWLAVQKHANFRSTRVTPGRLLAALALLTAAHAAGAGDAVTLDVPVDSKTSLSIERYAAPGAALVGMLPSEYGFQPGHAELARQLAAQNIEVWLADVLGAYFLNATPSELDAAPADAVVALIENAGRATTKQIYLLSNDRGAALALRGARAWQLRHADSDRLGGAILISPNVLTRTPEAGQDADYDPIASATNLPVFVLQPKLAVGFWQLGDLRRELSRGGGEVTLQTLPNIRDRFFFRVDASPEENAAARALPNRVHTAVTLLASARRARQAAAFSPHVSASKPGDSRRGLVAIADHRRPPALNVTDRAGVPRSLGQFRNQVVLVNFWASWCPPCVHEMPSMQQLRDHFRGRPFTLLAVNMAESNAAVDAFMTQHHLDFTVLMDRDGAALKRWKVMAFPTSFVVDKSGVVRYGVFGAIDWMEPETIRAISSLLDAP